MNINDILNLLLEDKSHLINKANLSDEEKYLVVKHFKQFPHKEKMIDWNKLSNLKFSDFKKVMDTDSKTHTKNKVKDKGIKGLSLPKDYEILYEDGLILVVMPKTWEASKHIASKNVGNKEAKWCTAFQKKDSYWKDYVIDSKGLLIYAIDFQNNDKMALHVLLTGKGQRISFWDSEDNKISGGQFKKMVFGNSDDKRLDKLISKAKEIRFDKKKFPQANDAWDGGDWSEKVWHGGLWKSGKFIQGVWEKGTWKTGTWKNGIWENGTWEFGIWQKGLWQKGTWKDGTWENGIWKKGLWQKGTWKDGTWENGIWYNGTWENGTWEGGTWYNGLWKNGTWEDGTWKSGWILDSSKKGNYKKDWEWKGDYVESPISPKEYFNKQLKESSSMLALI